MAKIVFLSRIPLLTTKSFFSIAATVIIVPIAYGALTGYMLGVSAIAFFALIALSIPGGFVAGCEHDKVAHGALRGLIGEVNLGLPSHHIPSWGRHWSLQLQGVWRNKKPFNVRYLYLGGHHVPQSQERCCVRIHPLPPWSAGACL